MGLQSAPVTFLLKRKRSCARTAWVARIRGVMRRSGLSTVNKINIACVFLGLLLGVLLCRRLSPLSPWFWLAAVLWCGGFGYVIGFFVSLIFVSRKYKDGP